ncbi:MAG: TetR/AcrR family transcriptional regulator [Candidatus Promineifilaceae bacterium]
MPRPRFTRLSIAKQERILEAAAREFTAYGYEGASMNKILQEAGISKGAAYYYFDDKADLYATTVQHYSHELFDSIAFDPAALTAERFWPALADLYVQQFTQFAARPWVFGVAKSGGLLSAEALAEGPLAEMWQQAQLLLVQLLQRGRELGVIRDDLPDELLLSWLIALDDAHDRWLVANIEELSPADLEQAALHMSDALRRLLSPGGVL